MKKYLLPLLLLIIILVVLSYVGLQIRWSKMLSPGELSLAHAELDLSEDCQACHTKGKRIDNGKCLDCHEEIREKMDLDLGLHGHASEECLDCHSEHHGLETDIAYFDKENLDNNRKGC